MSRRKSQFALMLTVLVGLCAPLSGQGINLARHAPASSTPSLPEFEPHQAVDGVVSNLHRWVSDAANSPHWLELDLLDEFEIGSANVFLGIDDAQAIASFALESWDNGWVPIPGASVTGNTATELQLIFTSPVTTSRVRFLTNEPGPVDLKELALFPPNGGNGYPLHRDVEIEVAIAPSITANSMFTNVRRPFNAVDGFVDDDSRWISAWSTNPKWLEIDFGDPVQVASVHLYTGADSDPTKTINDCQLEYWDGNAWVVLPETITTGNMSFELVFNLNNTVTASRMRLFSNDNFVRVREIAFFPPNGGAGYPIGTDVVIAPSPANQWTTYKDRLHTIESSLNGSLLDATSGLLTHTAYRDDSQRFSLLYVWDTDAFRIVNEESGACLQVDGASTQAGAAVEVGPYRGLDSQLWLIVPGAGTVKLVNRHSGMALELADDVVMIGSTLVQQPVAADPAQDWLLVDFKHHAKKGLGINDNGWPNFEYNTEALDVDWTFNWGLNAYATQPAGVDHQPMKWGNGGWDDYRRAMPRWPDGPPTTLQAFNEPGFMSQSNVPVEDAIYSWPRLEAARMPLTSPAPTNWNNTWMQSFMSEAVIEGIRIDTVAIHNYVQHTNADTFINNITNTYNTHGKPVWITEYGVVLWSGGVPSWTDEEVYSFFAEILYRMELLPELERHAVFLFPDDNPSRSPSALFETDQTTMKPLGRLYAAWDGDTNVQTEIAYYLHNEDCHCRLLEGGSVGLTTLDDIGDSSRWYLSSVAPDRYTINSMATGERLTATPSALQLAAPGTTGTHAEWDFVEDAHGWYFVENVAHGVRLTTQGGITVGVSAGSPTGDTARWRVIKPLNPCPIVGFDHDSDGDHDMHDFAALQACTGTFTSSPCDVFELDVDGEIDTEEFNKFFCFEMGP